MCWVANGFSDAKPPRAWATEIADSDPANNSMLIVAIEMDITVPFLRVTRLIARTFERASKAAF